MPFPFRRKSSSLVKDAVQASDAVQAGEACDAAPSADDASAPAQRKNYTPSKREQGKVTPKRVVGGRKAPEPPPANRREAQRRIRERRRAEREERSRGMAAGDERFMLKRDRGPERALARDVVDYRMTVGTWFFAGALIILIGSSPAMPLEVRFASNVVWIMLATATTIDGVLICRKVKRLVRQRFPKTEQSMGSLYFYAIMRSVTFRKMRMPRPRIKLGEEF